MSLRRAGTLLLAFALVACHTVNQGEQPAVVVFATFNSTTGAIPLPNDLALQGAPTVLPLAQREVLQAFIRSGGFPSDQEVPITVPFVTRRWNANDPAFPNGHYVETFPDLDILTVSPSTVVLLKADVSPPAVVPYEASYDASKGLLKLRKPAAADRTRHWAGGRYVVAVRGGASGVKVVGGAEILPDTGISLALQDKDLSNPNNQPPGMTPALAAQVEGLRQTLINPLDWSASASGAWAAAPSASVTSAFAAVDGVYPHAESAVIATFGITRDATVHVTLDAGAGEAPFPSDFMLDFNPANCPTNVAPCLAAALAPAFGAAGTPLRTLDGFSTTALLLAPFTGAVNADTITGANVYLFDLSTTPLPTLVKDFLSTAPTFVGAAYVLQPSSFNQTVGPKHLTTTLAMAPAVPVPVSASVTLAMPPLKEKTRYAVVITKRVKDAADNAITRGTVARLILETTAPLAGVVGTTPTSFVSGVDYATAAGLQALRDGLKPFLTQALPALTGGATTKDDVAMIYTVTTQSVTGTSLKLSVAPLGIEAGANPPTTSTAIFTPTAVTAFPAPPMTNVAGFYTVTFNSLDGIDKSSGGFRATLATDLASAATVPTLLTPLKALVAVPAATAAVPDCPGAPDPRAGGKCPRLVIFGHGLNGNRNTLLATASSLASAGFIAAAIDFPLHGERNWCKADADCTTDGTTANGTCDKAGAFATSAGQGDCGSFAPASAECQALRPGVCAGGSVPLMGAFPASVGSRFFVSANFFRVRDAFRQNLIDQAALALALARLPAPLSPQPAANPFASLLAGTSMFVDPTTVYYESISLGSLAGTSVVATNPRISRASLSVGGGPIVDVFTTSPSFAAPLEVLFGTLIPGFTFAAITPGNPAFSQAILSQYIQLLSVAKWILDPGDPINYAGHVRGAPFPNLLANPNGSVAQSAKDVFAQIALGDTVVPNPTNILLDTLLGGHTTIYSDDDPAGGPAPHSMLATIGAVQVDAAAFLADPAVFPAATKQVTVP